MSCSRRKFLESTLATAGALALNPLQKSRADSVKPGVFDKFEPAYLQLERTGELAEREKELWKIYEKCQLCPRKCEVNRLAA